MDGDQRNRTGIGVSQQDMAPLLPVHDEAGSSKSTDNRLTADAGETRHTTDTETRTSSVRS